MKRIITIFFIALLLFIFDAPLIVSAEDYSERESEISSQVDDILADYDIGYSYGDMSELSFSEIADRVKEGIISRIEAPLKMLGMLLIVIIFTGVLKGSGESFFPQSSTSNLYNMICVITAVTVITAPLLNVFSSALTAIERSGGFLLVFVPVFTGITIASGGITSAGVYNVMILAASEAITELSRSYLMPILSVVTAFSVSGSVFPNGSVDSIVNLLKKMITWGLTVAMTLFSGFVSLKCTLTGKADGVATKTAKFVISGFVPVVGSAVSDAYATVRSSFDVIRCTVGTAGNIAIILIMLPPVLEIIAFRAVMWVGAAAAELFSAEPLGKLMKGLDSGLAIAQSILICYSVLFVLCTGILMQSLT